MHLKKEFKTRFDHFEYEKGSHTGPNWPGFIMPTMEYGPMDEWWWNSEIPDLKQPMKDPTGRFE
jgi:hypothetical protein